MMDKVIGVLNSYDIWTEGNCTYVRDVSTGLIHTFSEVQNQNIVDCIMRIVDRKIEEKYDLK